MPSDSVFVPLETWVYHSPDVVRQGKRVDMGLLMEALIYYDRVYFAISNPEDFVELVIWFRGQGCAEELIALLQDGVLTPYYHAFATLAGHFDQVWRVMNLEDEEGRDSAVFEKRILRSGLLEASTRKTSVRERIIDAALSRHVEVKAAAFGAGASNAVDDFSDPARASMLVQVLVDEFYRGLGFAQPPSVVAKVHEADGLRRIDWNIDLRIFKEKLGLAVEPASPLSAAGFATKTIWSAGQLQADLYVGAPIGEYVNFKLGEGGDCAKTKLIVDELITEVAFPNVRLLINSNKIGFREVAELRKKATRFRQWLRTESTLDRNAIVAYHEEIAKASGWNSVARRALAISGVAAGATVGTVLAGPIGTLAGVVTGQILSEVAGEGIKFVSDVAAKFDEGWRPRVFGEWARARIDRALIERNERRVSVR